MSDDAIQALIENLGEPCALLVAFQICFERIDVRRQAALFPQMVKRVFIAGQDPFRVGAEPLGQRCDELRRVLGFMSVVRTLLSDEIIAIPNGQAIPAPVGAKGPARQGLARVPLALPVVHERAGRKFPAQPLQKLV